LNSLLEDLKSIKMANGQVNGMPITLYFDFAKSQISGVAGGPMRNPECEGCNSCCVLPTAIVPERLQDGSLGNKYVMKRPGQACPWLHKNSHMTACMLDQLGKRPDLCRNFLCKGGRESFEKSFTKVEDATNP